MNDFSKLEKLNFGFTPKPARYQTIQVTIDPTFMVADWAEAYARDLERRNPLKFQALHYSMDVDGVKQDFALDDAVIAKYMQQLIVFRVKDVNNQLKGVYHLLKQLGIPVWIQFAISQIGIAHDWDRGFEFVPILSESVDEVGIDEMLKISTLLRSFEPDGKPFFTNAWPKSKEGDADVMSYAIVDGFVTGNDKQAHPLKSYIAGFLGLKLQEELTYKMLHSVQYDEISILRTMLMTDAAVLE